MNTSLRETSHERPCDMLDTMLVVDNDHHPFMVWGSLGRRKGNLFRAFVVRPAEEVCGCMKRGGKQKAQAAIPTTKGGRPVSLCG